MMMKEKSSYKDSEGTNKQNPSYGEKIFISKFFFVVQIHTKLLKIERVRH